MTRLERFTKELCRTEYDAALISSQINQRYVSGFKYTSGYILITREKAFLLADFRYIEAARKTLEKTNFEVIQPLSGMLEAVASLLRENNVKTLLIEESSVSCSEFDRYKNSLGKDTELVGGASAILSKMRQVKDEEELSLIKKAQSITDAAFDHILKVMTPNMTEIEVALELEFFMRRNGAEDVAFGTIAVSGDTSSMPHGEAQSRPLQKGFFTMDFGALYEGYCADMTRTVVIGKADADMKKLYNTVLEAQRAALEMFGEGVSCYELDKCARDIIEGAGYRGCFGHSLGHGVGMVVHEDPRLAPSADRNLVLVRGNVTSCEPGIYVEGKYGCRIEDLVAIELDGKANNLTKSPKELIELF